MRRLVGLPRDRPCLSGFRPSPDGDRKAGAERGAWLCFVTPTVDALILILSLPVPAVGAWQATGEGAAEPGAGDDGRAGGRLTDVPCLDDLEHRFRPRHRPRSLHCARVL